MGKTCFGWVTISLKYRTKPCRKGIFLGGLFSGDGGFSQKESYITRWVNKYAPKRSYRIIEISVTL